MPAALAISVKVMFRFRIRLMVSEVCLRRAQPAAVTTEPRGRVRTEGVERQHG